MTVYLCRFKHVYLLVCILEYLCVPNEYVYIYIEIVDIYPLTNPIAIYVNATFGIIFFMLTPEVSSHTNTE